MRPVGSVKSACRTASVLSAIAVWAGASAICSGAPSAKSADAGDRIKEIGYVVDDHLKAGLLVPRKVAEELMAELTDIRNKSPLDKMFALVQARWHRSAAYCRLSLGRAKEAGESVAAWAALEPSVPAAWIAAHEVAAALGDKSASAKALRSYLKTSNSVFTPAGKSPPNLTGISNDELAKLMASPEQERERENFLESIGKLMGPVGKTVGFLSLVDPKTGKKAFDWKKDTGKAVVLLVWNSTVPSAQILFGAYRELHTEFAKDERVAFVSLNLLEQASLKPKETEAIKAADLPGLTHQENIASTASIYQKWLGTPPYPLLVVIGPDGVIRWTAGPKRLTSPIARQAAFVLAACLHEAASGEKLGEK